MYSLEKKAIYRSGGTGVDFSLCGEVLLKRVVRYDWEVPRQKKRKSHRNGCTLSTPVSPTALLAMATAAAIAAAAVDDAKYLAELVAMTIGT